MNTTYRLDLCYDGTRYKGWQKLGDTENTIQNRVETALSRILDQKTDINASGRTDAGVHAALQVCSFNADTSLSCAEILAKLRRYLPSDIGAVSLACEKDRFHARYNCKKKTYLYRVWNSDCPNVFERSFVYDFKQRLDVELMRKASEYFLGEHDFSAFTNAKKTKKSAVRRIDSIDIIENSGEILFYFTGNGFLQGMVRILVGTLLEIGSAQKDISSIPDIVQSKKRSNAGFTAPAKGLTLYNVMF